MYTRVPDRKTSKPNNISIPENYSGNAFLQDQPYRSIFENKPYEAYETQEAKKEILTPAKDAEAQIEALPEISQDTVKNNSLAKKENENLEDKFTSLLPFASSKSLKNHFPFGHGIGSEELLILGIMSLIFTSDDESGTDGELIMLLALLLFAG